MLTRRNWRIILSLLILTALTAWSALLYVGDDRLHVYFFDVGQGDSIMLKINDFEILIDGGPDETALNQLGGLLPPWDRTIEVVILTHPHADHVTGLVEIFKRYQVETVWGTGLNHTSDIYLNFLKTIREQRINFRVVSSGDRLQHGNLTMDILYPQENLAGQRLENANLSSIVALATYGNLRILLTGDAENPIQEKLLRLDINLMANVIKVPHQGSRDASSLNFLERVKPAYAVLSVGKNNRYGHPHAEVLQLYEALKIEHLRTDRDGTVQLTSDGQETWIRTKKTGIVSKIDL